MAESFIRFFIISAAVLFYYWIVVSRLGPISRPLADRLGLGQRYPLRDISAVLNLPVAGLSQAVLCYGLILLTGVEITHFILGTFQPILILYGILLGIGTMALATFFCNLGMRLATSFDPAGDSQHLEDWQVLAKGGWMRYYQRTLEIAPPPVAILSSLLYIAGEEIIFRGVFICYFLPDGATYALGVSVVSYVLVQIFHMPNWRAAMFPVIGAIVIGIVHGLLFIAVPNIIPLIIAHFVFFMVAAL